MPNTELRTTNEVVAELLYGTTGSDVMNSVFNNNTKTKQKEDHKAEILATRKGGFGSSDASMLIDIATIKKVMPKHYKRLAVFEGIIEPEDFSTPAMETGNQREREIFDYYTKLFPESCLKSNPIYYDTKNIFSNEIKCFTHIDMVEILNNDENCYNIKEIKTSKKDTEDLIKIYDSQLKWHCVLANRNIITLIHYQENHDGGDFDSGNIKSKIIVYAGADLSKFITQIQSGLEIVKLFLEEQKEKDYADLREHCKEPNKLALREDTAPANIIKEMDASSKMEKMVAHLTEALNKKRDIIQNWMVENDIKIYKYENMEESRKYTRIDSSIINSFDTTRFKKEQPDLYEQYIKETQKKPYLKLEIKQKEVANGI